MERFIHEIPAPSVNPPVHRHYDVVVIGGGMSGLCAAMASARQAARESGSIVLLNGHRTCVTDGTRDYRNPTGNPGMAVGGSGDVLAGILTGLLGQGLEPLEAAAVGAWLHGRAGDLCAEALGEYGMLPTDLLGYLPRLLK